MGAYSVVCVENVYMNMLGSLNLTQHLNRCVVYTVFIPMLHVQMCSQ